MFLDIVTSVLVILLFAAVGVFLLFYPHRIVRWTTHLFRRYLLLFYRDVEKIPEKVRDGITRRLEHPETAAAEIRLHRIGGVVFLVAAIMLLVFLLLPPQ